MADDAKKESEDHEMALGFFGVWFVGSLCINVTFDWFLWWHSFIFIVLYAFLSIPFAPVVKGLGRFIWKKPQDTKDDHFVAVVAWPFSLILYLFIAFFVAIGRIAK